MLDRRERSTDAAGRHGRTLPLRRARWGRRRRAWVLGLLSSLVGSPTGSGAFAAAPYEGHSVVKLWPADGGEWRFVDELRRGESLGPDRGRGVWTWGESRASIDLQVSAQARALLEMSGIRYEVTHADLQGAVEAERERIEDYRLRFGAHPTLNEYMELPQIEAMIDAWVDIYPGLVEVETLGDSLEGRPIRSVKITATRPDSGAGALLIIGTQHAREWLANHALFCVIDQLIRGYGQDPYFTALLEKIEVHVIPVVNPDGYVQTWNGQRLWRKNKAAPQGVDLNRNYASGWGQEGSSGDPSAENYRGPEAFSEPESKLVRDYLLGLTQAEAFLDVHTWGEKILRPYGFTREPAPRDADHERVAAQMELAINAVHNERYEATRTIDFWVAAGISSDWAADAMEGRGLAMTIEVRPISASFIEPPEQIMPTCEEIAEGIWVLADAVQSHGDPWDDGTETEGEGEGEDTLGTETADTSATGDASSSGDDVGSSASDDTSTTAEDDGDGDGDGDVDSDDDDDDDDDEDDDAGPDAETRGGEANAESDEGCTLRARGDGPNGWWRLLVG